MNQEPSLAAGSFGAVSLAITLVSLVALSTILYSAYADYNGAIGVLGQKSPTPGISTRTVVQGTSATVYLNVTVPNKGLYGLRVGLSCLSNVSSGVTCTNVSVTVPPGGEETLHFAMTFRSLSPLGSVPTGISANLSLSLVPFVSFDIEVPLSSLAGRGG